MSLWVAAAGSAAAKAPSPLPHSHADLAGLLFPDVAGRPSHLPTRAWSVAGHPIFLPTCQEDRPKSLPSWMFCSRGGTSRNRRLEDGGLNCEPRPSWASEAVRDRDRDRGLQDLPGKHLILQSKGLDLNLALFPPPLYPPGSWSAEEPGSHPALLLPTQQRGLGGRWRDPAPTRLPGAAQCRREIAL